MYLKGNSLCCRNCSPVELKLYTKVTAFQSSCEDIAFFFLVCRQFISNVSMDRILLENKWKLMKVFQKL